MDEPYWRNDRISCCHVVILRKKKKQQVMWASLKELWVIKTSHPAFQIFWLWKSKFFWKPDPQWFDFFLVYDSHGLILRNECWLSSPAFSAAESGFRKMKLNQEVFSILIQFSPAKSRWGSKSGSKGAQGENAKKGCSGSAQSETSAGLNTDMEMLCKSASRLDNRKQRQSGSLGSFVQRVIYDFPRNRCSRFPREQREQ